MTQEKKLVFQLEDIKTVRLVCRNSKCGGEVSRPPHSAYDQLPGKCAYCNTPWSDQGFERRFLSALKDMLLSTNNAAKLKFDMDYPVEAEPEQ